ncbi:MAG: uracil-DNA glycosylase, partial [Bacteroidales bacterium]|nr:uracil-DNA glycosylase [Bacteroidales bacterium]
MDVRIDASWKQHLQPEFDKAYFANLVTFVKNAYATQTVYPPAKYIFNAFDLCPFDQVKVVILGQDPYHEPGQAHGLSFSVPEGIALPPSLQNIFKEIENDLGYAPMRHGNLERWAKQGVLLLNATLSVQAHQAGSHQNNGWEQFTAAVIAALSKEREHLVFLWWGRY